MGRAKEMNKTSERETTGGGCRRWRFRIVLCFMVTVFSVLTYQHVFSEKRPKSYGREMVRLISIMEKPAETITIAKPYTRVNWSDFKRAYGEYKTGLPKDAAYAFFVKALAAQGWTLIISDERTDTGTLKFCRDEMDGGVRFVVDEQGATKFTIYIFWQQSPFGKTGCEGRSERYP